MRRSLALVTLFLLMSGAAQAALSDSAAMSKAQSIWGPNASIAKFRTFGDSNWTMQVGCIDPASHVFIIAGQGLNVWDAAFAAVDITVNGPQTSSTTGQITYACNQPPLSITVPLVMPNGSQGSQYKQQLTVSGGTPPYAWTVINLLNAGFGPSPLPPGIGFSGNTLSGLPTTAGTYNFTLFVSDALNHVATLPVSLTIAGQEEDE